MHTQFFNYQNSAINTVSRPIQNVLLFLLFIASVNANNHIVSPAIALKRDEAGGNVEFKELTEPLLLVPTKKHSDALPGQKLTLKADFILPPNTSVISWKWTVNGQIFADYVANNNTGKKTNVAPFNGSIINYYWINHGNHQVSAEAKLSNGDILAVAGVFNVEQPPNSFTSTHGITKLNADQYFGLQDNNGNPNINGDGCGIVFEAKVEVPQHWPGGTWNFVQMVVPNRFLTLGNIKYMVDMNGQSVLDTEYPYQNPIPPYPTGAAIQKYYDTPGFDLGDPVSPIREVSVVNEQFKTWTMFTPPGHSAKEVPLKVIFWSWGGDTKKVNGAFTPAVNPAQNAAPAVDTTHHPEWTLNISNQNLIPTPNP